MSPRLLLLLLFAGLGCTGVSVHAWGSVAPVPSESECRPYIEKALKELSTESTQEAVDTAPSPDTPQTTDTSTEGSEQEGSIDRTEESVTTDSAEKEEGDKSKEDDGESKEDKHQEESEETDEQAETKDTDQGESGETEEEGENGEEKEQSGEQPEETESKPDDEDSGEGEKVESIEKEDQAGDESTESQETVEGEDKEGSAEKQEDADETKEGSDETKEGSDEEDSRGKRSAEDVASVEDQEGDKSEEQANQAESTEEGAKSAEESTEDGEASGEEVLNAEQESQEDDEKVSAEATDEEETKESHEEQSGEEGTKEETSESAEQGDGESAEADAASAEESGEADTVNTEESGEADTASAEESGEAEDKTKEQSDEATESDEAGGKESEPSESQEKVEDDDKEKESTESEETAKEAESVEDEEKEEKSDEEKSKEEEGEGGEDSGEEKSEEEPASKAEESEEESSTPEEDLTIDVVIPEKLRPREHINQILKLDSASVETELLLSKTMDITLRELKRLYDTAIQPLEILYKYRDLSNRHFGDPEIFSKPLILFMGPWSGGKSTIINYLLGNEYTKSALRTGAEPSPAYFNILMWGEQEEVLDGTQLAADWTFSGLQKFGQGLLDRLRGLKLKTPLLEKVNIVEIPGILEIRKQVERLFPFNDACQWFIDRADIIFLVYDPSKLDVGPETEAILDQLKGREYQTRIILNKADQVKPEELMRVQGTLIWNISPLMSSSEPPVMYSTSLWSIPYEVGSPSRLLYAQERAFLRDLRDAIDKRVENKIASARRFAVRVRNHAKMVDCYLTTYYNHKSFFGNRKKVADDIIEHPQNYHIYEGLSTLTNISRYDLPDPEVYRDFFRLNAVYDFQQLSSTCTYFRGCPINRLDVAIAYDLPELVGKYKKSAEAVLTSAEAPPKS